MQSSERNRQLNKERYDVLSITGYVFKKKKLTHGARHGPSVQQCMHHKEYEMLKKARKHKNGDYKNIMDRWNNNDKLYGSSQLRSYSNHSQDTGCTIMDDFMTKADDLFPTQTQIENLTLQPDGLNAQRVRATNKRCACAIRETRTQTAQGIHNSM